MKKHLFTALVLTTAMLSLQACGGDQAAPKKAAVDVKAKPAAPQPAGKSATAKASTEAAQKAAGAAQKTPDGQKAAAPGAQKATADAQKASPPGATAKATVPALPKSQTEGKAGVEPQKDAGQKPEADAQKQTGETKTAAVDKESLEPLSPFTVPKGYRYEPRGRRDPFVNPIPKPVSASAKPLARPDGLPGVLVSEMKVSGIIYAPDPTMKKAILAAGKKTYFAKQGDHLFDAVIREIRPNEVVFTMVSTTTKQPLGRETVVSTGASGRR